jgi:hypothetical protein
MRRWVWFFLIFITSSIVFGKSIHDDNAFVFKDSSGNKYDYYFISRLFFDEETEVVGKFCGGDFTIIKKVSENG